MRLAESHPDGSVPKSIVPTERRPTEPPPALLTVIVWGVGSAACASAVNVSDESENTRRGALLNASVTTTVCGLLPTFVAVTGTVAV